MWTDVVSFLRDLGRDDSVPGALVVALATTALAMFGWIIKGIGLWIWNLYVSRRLRRSSLIVFFNFVKIRRKNCLEIYGEQKKISYLDLISHERRKDFKVYTVNVSDGNQYDAIERYLPTFPVPLMHKIKMLMDYDRLLEAQYLKTGSDDFGALSIKRKQAVVSSLFDTGNDVVRIADDTLNELREYKFLRKLDAKIDPLLNKVEGESLTKAADEVQSSS